MRLIDGDELKAVLEGLFFPHSTQEICEVIDAQPTIDAQSVRLGRWIYKPAEGTACSMCGKMTICEYKFCPNCGARMDGGVEE